MHLLFGGAVVIVLLIGFLSKVAAGEHIFRAVWDSTGDVRPVEWVMIVLFWYGCAFQRLQSGWTTGEVTTLGLSGPE